MLDILIKNGTVIDGMGKPANKADIAIQDGKITAIESVIKAKSLQTIDASDRIVSPGFIDIQNHSDSYWTILDQPSQFSLLSQGITTIVMGNCGASLAPLLSKESIKSIQKWHNLSGVNVDWMTMAEFLQYLGNVPHGVNVGTLVGHSTIRRGILGDSTRPVSDDEIKIMKNILTNALDQGAFGMSMGLVYAHEVNSSEQELRTLATVLNPKQKYLSVHLRSEDSHILESLDEVIDLALIASVPIKISHLKVRGKKNWPLFERLMTKLEIAYHQGINISFDVYPYDTSWSVLYTYLPKWTYEGGRDQILKMIGDPVTRRKIWDYLKAQEYDFDKVIVSEASSAPNFVGKSLKQIGDNQSVSAEEATLNVLLAGGAQVMVFDHNLSNEHVELLCASPLSMIATDGAGHSTEHPHLIHPRCFGTMPRFLRMIRENKLLKWEQAIMKITSEPAKLLGLPNLGQLAKDKLADVVIFDPKTITDKADYKNASLVSVGIDGVIVNGKLSYTNQEVVGLNGMVIKR